MHCVRRAALRAACSSSRFVAVPRQQIAVIGIQSSKASVRPASALPLSRYFSQTTSVAAEEDEYSRNAESSYDDAGEETESPQVNALRSSPTEAERAAQDACSIFISNMTFDATDVHLKEAFGKYGDIMSCNIARDGRGLSRGFGFITFSSKEAASRAVDEAHDSFWHGRRINVALRKQSENSNTRPGAGAGARQGGVSTPTNSLYIGNIPYEASDADLNQLFRSLDNVRDVRVAVDRNTGWPRGFAHADFLDVESAKKAHDHLLEVTLNGRTLRVDYAENRTRNDQQRR